MEVQDEQEGAQEYASLPAGTKAFIAELLATMSHELRTPLATIKAYTDTLLHREHSIASDERHTFLLAIKQAGDHLEVVIDHLLEMASLETGVLTLEMSTVNLVQLLRETVSAAERRAEAEQGVTTHRLRFHLEDQSSVPADAIFIEADRDLLRKVLDQLLENAINYSPEGGTIEVALRTVSSSDAARPAHLPLEGGDGHAIQVVPSLPGGPDEQERVEISVHDEGLGIAAEHLGWVFDPFYRVDTRLAREVNGLGIGLANCKRIVELHGGTIRVESTVGAGSTFHVWLPRGGPRVPSA
jgi:signal transduction histidine kinase